MLAIVVGACGLGSSSPEPVVINGSIYTDFRIDLPCEQQTAPTELVGVILTVRDGSGEVIGQAATREVVGIELPRTPETQAWANGGCRFAAPYTVAVTKSEAYAIAFTPADLGNRPGTGFTGVEDLEPQTLTHEELAAAQFVWTFEASPTFAVP